MERYCIVTKDLRETERKFELSIAAFRLEYIQSNVLRPEQGYIDGVYFDVPGSTEPATNQLLGSIDLWFLSEVYLSGLVSSFLDEHGLVGKTNEQIDDYLDEHELSIPGPMSLMFPGASAGTTIRLTGKFLGIICLFGWGSEKL